MSILGTTLGRMAYGAAQLSNKYVDEDLALKRAQAMADIQQASMVKSDQYMNSPERRNAMRTQAGLDASATAAGALQADIARTGSVPLQDATIAATNRMTSATSGTKAEAEGLMARAKAENTPYDLSPGNERRIGADKIAENMRPTAAEVTRDAYAAGQKGGGTAKVDHFDEKAWSTARNKLDLSVVTFADPLSGKAVESPELRQVYRTQFGKLKESGNFDPDTASDMARETTLLLKRKAEDMVRAARAVDKKSELTEDAAVQQILKQYEAAQRAAAPRPAAAAGAAPAAAALTPSPTPSKPAAAAPPPPAEYVPPPDSIVGKARAAAADREKKAAAELENKRVDAAQVYATIKDGDRVNAAKLQASDLFGMLTREQKVRISNIVNGR